jgi:hypothetical protein
MWCCPRLGLQISANFQPNSSKICQKQSFCQKAAKIFDEFQAVRESWPYSREPRNRRARASAETFLLPTAF